MEPIVSPWFIYFLSLVDSIICLLVTTAILSAIALLIYYIGFGMTAGSYSQNERERWVNGWKGKAKLLWILIVVCVPLSVFIPSKNTLIAMYVADNITPNNVEKALEVGKDFKEEIKKDIFELIEAIQKDENKSNE